MSAVDPRPQLQLAVESSHQDQESRHQACVEKWIRPNLEVHKHKGSSQGGDGNNTNEQKKSFWFKIPSLSSARCKTKTRALHCYTVGGQLPRENGSLCSLCTDDAFVQHQSFLQLIKHKSDCAFGRREQIQPTVIASQSHLGILWFVPEAPARISKSGLKEQDTSFPPFPNRLPGAALPHFHPPQTPLHLKPKTWRTGGKDRAMPNPACLETWLTNDVTLRHVQAVTRFGSAPLSRPSLWWKPTTRRPTRTADPCWIQLRGSERSPQAPRRGMCCVCALAPSPRRVVATVAARQPRQPTPSPSSSRRSSHTGRQTCPFPRLSVVLCRTVCLGRRQPRPVQQSPEHILVDWAAPSANQAARPFDYYPNETWAFKNNPAAL